MDTNNYDVTVSYEITSSNESWRTIMDEGMPAPEVTGGTIQLPQGGTDVSHAAVIGGIFLEGSEAASYAEDNSKKIISSVISDEIQARIGEIISGESLDDLEYFLSNIAKSEYLKIANEFKDNPNETEATNMVIDSLYVHVTIAGLPTMDEIRNLAKEVVVQEIQKVLGGDSL